MFRSWLVLAFCAPVMFFALSGCALYSGEGGQGGSSTITFLHWRGEDTKVFDEIIRKFEAENEGVNVEQSALPSDAYTAQAQPTIVSGEGADIFATMPGSQIQRLSGTDVYADLSGEEFVSRFDPEFIEAGNVNGKQLVFPYQLVFNIPVYNAGLLEENGIDPEGLDDWDSFLAACDTLKEAGVAPIAFAGNTSASQFINPMMMNNQPDEEIWPKVESGEAKVTDEWFVKTLSQIQELQDRGCFQPDALGSSQEGASALFAQEEAAMLALGSYQMAAVKEQNPEIEQGLLAPITVPANEKVWDGIYTSTFMLGVNSKSQNAEAATAFVEFLTRPEIASEYANGTGQLLTLKDVTYETEELQAQLPWREKNVRFQPRFTITKDPINQGLITSVEDVLSGVSPEEAAQKLQGVVDREMER